jgi:hypothetical protein
MRLEKKQREALITWVAAGFESDEINKRAARFKPPFKVSRRTVTHYRQTRGTDLEEIKEAAETDALKTGYAIREKRVADMQLLAEKMFGELTREGDNLFWTTQAKTVANEKYDYLKFNRSEIEAFLHILDDIAKEVGERRPDTVVNNNFNFNMEEWKKQSEARLKAVEEMDAD